MSVKSGEDQILKLKIEPSFTFDKDYIIQWESDIFKDRSISSLIRVALFPINDNDKIIDYNLDIIQDLIELMQRNFNNDFLIQSSFTEQFYQIALWLIAFIDTDITLDFIFYKKTITIPNGENRDKAANILFELIDWLFKIVFSLDYKKNSKIIKDVELFNILLSINYILIHYNNNHKLSLTENIEKRLLENLYKIKKNQIKLSMANGKYESIKLFIRFLNKYNMFPVIRRKLTAYLRYVDICEYSYYKRDSVSFIKRPITAFENDTFEKLDREIFD